MDEKEKVTYFAETDYRKKRPFGIKAVDRLKHVYVIGKTGMGKSTMLENMAVQDIQNGNGVCFVDPHGKSAELLLRYVPKERLDDVIYFAPFDMEHPMSFNIMEDVGYDKRHLVANGLMSAFKKIWIDAWSARMEYILSNVILALLEYPDSTLLGVNKMLTDKVYRKKVIDNMTDPAAKSFWVDEYTKYTDRYTQDATPAIQNKVGQFTANPLIRNIIGQPKSSFDFRDAMDTKKIVIVNLAKGRIGEGNANLLGSMIITKLYLSAMSRADLDEFELDKKPAFYLYVDEFQSFANESFADILSEARKYKLSLTIAHQYVEQMPEEVRSAVFGNVGTTITFRVGAYDADILEKEFAPKFFVDDLVNLGFVQIYLKLMIDGVSSQPFSARTLPPIQVPEHSNYDFAIARSRELYAKPRVEVEKVINDLYSSSEAMSSSQYVEKDKKSFNKKDSSRQFDRPRPSQGGSFDKPHRDFERSERSFRPRADYRSGQSNQPEKPRDFNRPEKSTERSSKESFSRDIRNKRYDNRRVSLSDLKQKKTKEMISTEKNIENFGGLKDALKQVMEQEKQKIAIPEVKQEIKKESVMQGSIQPPKSVIGQKKSSVSDVELKKEVPEDVLKGVLEG